MFGDKEKEILKLVSSLEEPNRIFSCIHQDQLIYLVPLIFPFPRPWYIQYKSIYRTNWLALPPPPPPAPLNSLTSCFNSIWECPDLSIFLATHNSLIYRLVRLSRCIPLFSYGSVILLSRVFFEAYLLFNSICPSVWLYLTASSINDNRLFLWGRGDF